MPICPSTDNTSFTVLQSEGYPENNGRMRCLSFLHILMPGTHTHMQTQGDTSVVCVYTHTHTHTHTHTSSPPAPSSLGRSSSYQFLSPLGRSHSQPHKHKQADYSKHG